MGAPHPNDSAEWCASHTPPVLYPRVGRPTDAATPVEVRTSLTSDTLRGGEIPQALPKWPCSKPMSHFCIGLVELGAYLWGHILLSDPCPRPACPAKWLRTPVGVVRGNEERPPHVSMTMTTAMRYLKHHVFDPGTKTARSKCLLPREKPTRKDWDHLIKFWHNHASTGGKPLGKWSNTSHQIWQWYCSKEDNDLQQIECGRIYHYKLVRVFQLTRSTSTYQR
jgi:hypothetical protein